MQAFHLCMEMMKTLIYMLCGLGVTFCGYIRHPGDLHYIHPSGKIQTLAWGVRLKEHLNANSVAKELGLINLGVIGVLEHHFVFVHPMYSNVTKTTLNATEADAMFVEINAETERRLHGHPDMSWYKQEVMRHRAKRDSTLHITDPYFTQQWHLRNVRRKGFDLNVTGLWERNITGRGITVSVVDDGLEWTNKDLINNYKQKGSWDLNDNDMDPTPSKDGAKNEHGTRCAGEIAAERNDFCGIGVAYEAGISGIKVLDGKMTDSMEATAFHMNMDVNDIYSCSWGPEDDGATIDGPHHLTSMAMEYGVNNGRNGYGAIYVVASGNGGVTNDNCNFDGYANSIYTVTIGAVDEYGYVPYYAEECAAMLAVTLSSGGKGDRNIVTTDWTEVDGTGCTVEHTGTSAAAPLAAAVIALMLQVRSCLTWRDVQYLVVITSVQVNKEFPDWHKNAAGLFHSHHHGFGLLTAWKLVSAAKTWSSVPWMSTFSTGTLIANEVINVQPNQTRLSYNLTEQIIQPYFIWIMEYVRVRITVIHSKRGQLELRLQAPSGSESVLSKPRTNDKSADGFKDWVFTTVRFWGEKPAGKWGLVLTDHDNGNTTRGVITKWELIISGTPIPSSEFQSRIRLAREAAETNVLDDENYTLPCRPPLKRLGEEVLTISDKILQVLCFFGGFLFIMAVFETLEYIFCYDEEKRKFYQEMMTRFRLRRQRNPGGTLESTPLITENENDSVTCLEMTTRDDVRRYRGCDLMLDISVTDEICDDIEDDVNVKDLSTSNT